MSPVRLFLSPISCSIDPVTELEGSGAETVKQLSAQLTDIGIPVSPAALTGPEPPVTELAALIDLGRASRDATVRGDVDYSGDVVTVATYLRDSMKNMRRAGHDTQPVALPQPEDLAAATREIAMLDTELRMAVPVDDSEEVVARFVADLSCELQTTQALVDTVLPVADTLAAGGPTVALRDAAAERLGRGAGGLAAGLRLIDGLATLAE